MLNFDALNEDKIQDYLREHEEMPETQAPAIRDPFDPAPVEKLFVNFATKIGSMAEKASLHTVTDKKSNAEAVMMTNQAKAIIKQIEDKRVEVKKPYLSMTKAIDGFCKPLKDSLDLIQTDLNGKIQPYLQEQEKKRQEEERKRQEEARKEQERLEAIAEAERQRIAEEARKERERLAAIKAEEDRIEAERLAEIARKKAIEEGLAQEEADRQAAIAKEKADKEAAEQAAIVKAEEEKKAEEEAAHIVAPTVVVAELPEALKVATESGTADLKKDWAWDIESFSAIPPEAFEARKKEVTKALAPWLNAQVKAGIRTIPGVKVYEKTTLQTRARR